MHFQRSLEVPYCFYPQNFGGYRYINVTEAQWGLTAYMQREFFSPYPEDIPVLRMDIKMESKQRLHIKVARLKNRRAVLFELKVILLLDLRSIPFTF